MMIKVQLLQLNVCIAWIKPSQVLSEKENEL